MVSICKKVQALQVHTHATGNLIVVYNGLLSNHASKGKAGNVLKMHAIEDASSDRKLAAA